MTILSDLADPRSKRSKSAHKIAACVLADPQAILATTTASLAAMTGVSEPTVNRFCTGLGYKGFPDFKLALAAELARKQPRITRNINPDDSAGKVAAKIFDSTHASLSNTQDHLDLGALQDVVEAMNSARSVALCGLGASASVALDAQHKLLRFPIPVMAHTDIINQRMLAAGLTPHDLLVCISYTGRTTAIIEVAQLARERNCPVVGITSPDSPLAKACSLVLGVASGENTDLYTPMTSRIAQLVIVDIIATCLALRQPGDFGEHLREIKRKLGKTRR
ncbi:transcriptional regulator HexR [Seongchinamella sediminis]|uniref:Transcriptional regulator HexR n=1 Tax=Seongchinamella sediminis TaxID=2283635 RepID=A0A3L7E1U2_9GAMM|nr:transcriptional regulator HexR [Seongchinamella sediminis]RLQ22660.1 transcriptional regulator HexR [Seongchinamella sediminis]